MKYEALQHLAVARFSEMKTLGFSITVSLYCLQLITIKYTMYNRETVNPG